MDIVATILRLIVGFYILVGSHRKICNLLICRDLFRQWRGTREFSRPDVRAYFKWLGVYIVSVLAMIFAANATQFEDVHTFVRLWDSAIADVTLLIIVLNIHLFAGARLSPETFLDDLY